MASLNLSLSDAHITPEGLGIAIGHLYASYSASILKNSAGTPAQRAALLISVLSSASLLRLADLAHMTTQLIKADISLATVALYTAFVSHPDKDYGASSVEIRDTIFEFLCQGLLKGMARPWDKEGEEYQVLVQIFSGLPYEWLKKVVESKTFEVPSDMERYAFVLLTSQRFTFAKKVISVRSASKPKSAHFAGEENVLLSFGASKSGASGVTIVRKASRPAMVNGSGHANGYERKIWKADIGV